MKHEKMGKPRVSKRVQGNSGSSVYIAHPARGIPVPTWQLSEMAFSTAGLWVGIEVRKPVGQIA